MHADQTINEANKPKEKIMTRIPKIYITVNASAGAHFNDVWSDAVNVAQRIGIPVKVEFGGAHVLVQADTSCHEAWQQVQESRARDAYSAYYDECKNKGKKPMEFKKFFDEHKNR